MTPKELNENKLEKAVGGKLVQTENLRQKRLNALDRRIAEGAIQCKGCGDKLPENFTKGDYDPDGVNLRCKSCGVVHYYEWQELSIG